MFPITMNEMKAAIQCIRTWAISPGNYLVGRQRYLITKQYRIGVQDRVSNSGGAQEGARKHNKSIGYGSAIGIQELLKSSIKQYHGGSWELQAVEEVIEYTR